VRRPVLSSPRPRIVSAALALWIAALAWSGCAPRTPMERVDRLVAELDWRPPAGRLCCGRGHRPLSSPSMVYAVPPARLAAALGKVLRSHRQAPGAETAAALAVLEMLEGDWPAAIARFEEAVSIAPERGELLADLSTARLSRANVEERPHEHLRALKYTENATRQAPDLPDAWFNHAAILDRNELRWEAS